MSEQRRRPRGRPDRGPAARADEARLVAYDLLRMVDERAAYANLALPGLMRDRGLSGRDAAFATELAFGTLRLRGRYDAMIAASSSRPFDQIDPQVVTLLRMGAHQVHGMRVPEYAAVSATVSLANRIIGASRGSFVNALMRTIAGRPLPEWLADMDQPAATSHPAWIIEAFRQALSAQGAADELDELLAVDNTAPGVCLIARPGRCERARLLDESGGVPTQWSPWGVRLTRGDPAAVAQVRSGAAGIQDEGSQLMALAFSRLRQGSGSDGERWLDMCAGPGGKAAVLAGLAAERGVELLAIEQHPHRADLVRQAVGRAATTEVRVADATSLADPEPFSRILLDAPCTGLGAVRRRPDLRWHREQADLPVLRAIQIRLLQAAVGNLAPGGSVAYVTCSPHLAETDDVVRHVVSRTAGVVWDDARPLLTEVPDLGPGPAARLWPQRHGTDGMYLAVLRRDQD